MNHHQKNNKIKNLFKGTFLLKLEVLAEALQKALTDNEALVAKCAEDRLALQKALTDNEALAAKCEELEPHRALYGCLQEVVIRTPPNYGQT